jgi:hypothetical protein
MCEENKKETVHEASWIKHYWRPAIAWQYFAVCLFDFILAPILTAIYAAMTKIPYVPWDPITLKETGLYHIAMGAILGVAAWTRGYEKISRFKMNENVDEEESLNRRKRSQIEEH